MTIAVSSALLPFFDRRLPRFRTPANGYLWGAPCQEHRRSPAGGGALACLRVVEVQGTGWIIQPVKGQLWGRGVNERERSKKREIVMERRLRWGTRSSILAQKHWHLIGTCHINRAHGGGSRQHCQHIMQ